MERESFEDEEVGKMLSDNFVCIKVDREERPDVDKVYMTFVQVGVFTFRPRFPCYLSLPIIYHDFVFPTSPGNKWGWRMAHECVVDP